MYIRRFKPGIKRKMLEISYKGNGTPIAIPVSVLKCNVVEIQTAINARLSHS